MRFSKDQSALRRWRLPLAGALVALAFTGAPPNAHAHGVADQTNDPPSSGSVACPVQTSQSFTPAASSLVAVDLRLEADESNPPPPGGAPATVNIRSGSPTGPIVGSATATVPSTTADSLVHFDFAAPLVLTPEATYVIELVVGPTVRWRLSGEVDPYPRGAAFYCGTAPLAGDFNFITYAAVAPPVTVTLTPTTGTNAVGQFHLMTVTLSRGGQPAAGERFCVVWTAGPNAGDTFCGTVFANGFNVFSFTADAPGVDTMLACHDANANNACDAAELVGAAAATKTWVPPTLALTPATATNPAGQAHTVTATLSFNGAPISDARILFSVAPAPTPGPATGSDTTEAAGTATFTFTSATVGTFTITACHDANNSGTCDPVEQRATTTKTFVDLTPPSCVVVIGANQIRVTANDPESGLSGIAVTTAVNVSLTGAPQTFVPPTFLAQVVLATRINRAVPMRLALLITNGAGLTTPCDPILSTLAIGKRNVVSRTYTGIPYLENKLTIRSLRGGPLRAVVQVNGRVFRFSVKGQKRISLASAMTHLRGNKVKITLYGNAGARALVALTD